MVNVKPVCIVICIIVDHIVKIRLKFETHVIRYLNK